MSYKEPNLVAVKEHLRRGRRSSPNLKNAATKNYLQRNKTSSSISLVPFLLHKECSQKVCVFFFSVGCQAKEKKKKPFDPLDFSVGVERDLLHREVCK